MPTPEGAPPPLTQDSALFLDFDGTLAELAPRPDSVHIDPALPALLQALSAWLGGALAIISGRPLADLDARLAPVLLPAAGLHGAEWRARPDQPAQRKPEPSSLDSLIAKLRSHFGADPRVLVEDKGPVVALHFRQAPERAQECIETVQDLANDPLLEVIQGHAVVEARPRGIDKGKALQELIAEPPFAGRRPVFVGDDRTDEDGFRLAQQLGGHAIKVGDGQTAAQYRCPSVREVHAWLQASLQAGAEAVGER